MTNIIDHLINLREMYFATRGVAPTSVSLGPNVFNEFMKEFFSRAKGETFTCVTDNRNLVWCGLEVKCVRRNNYIEFFPRRKSRSKMFKDCVRFLDEAYKVNQAIYAKIQFS